MFASAGRRGQVCGGSAAGASSIAQASARIAAVSRPGPSVASWAMMGSLCSAPSIRWATMSASASVGPGKTFVLGTQTYTNSVDDPVNGVSGVVFPHKFAPLLLIGYGNILPRSGKRLTFPLEIGAAYTGASVIDMGLNGTACTTQGCFDFASSQKAQSDLKQEIYNLNEDLKRYPVFPIVSIGVAYHF